MILALVPWPVFLSPACFPLALGPNIMLFMSDTLTDAPNSGDTGSPGIAPADTGLGAFGLALASQTGWFLFWVGYIVFVTWGMLLTAPGNTEAGKTTARYWMVININFMAGGGLAWTGLLAANTEASAGAFCILFAVIRHLFNGAARPTVASWYRRLRHWARTSW